MTLSTIIAIANTLFALALLLQIIRSLRTQQRGLSWATCVLTAIQLWCVGVCLLLQHHYYSGVVTCICAVEWMYLSKIGSE